jgi:hypothetical protein
LVSDVSRDIVDFIPEIVTSQRIGILCSTAVRTLKLTVNIKADGVSGL